ncbi:MAG: hypothetical protein H6704_10340 [Myxococcales bacterium]|nr:hypothetical protein [Myxococcales bacterium]MCB9536642.1 hypothetical protein [Myxococcales bacterium]
MGFTAYLVATMLVAADVGCAEATHDWREVEAVLQVAHNRSLLRGEPMLDVLTAHRQFARECPAHRVRVRHLWAGLRAVVGALEVPRWLKDPTVQFFCTQRVAWKWRQRRGWARRIEQVGRLKHLYWRWRPGMAIASNAL